MVPQIYRGTILSELLIPHVQTQKPEMIRRKISEKIEILKNQEVRFGTASRQAVEKEYSLETWKGRMRRIFEGVIEEK